jgi:hypothetical protein
VRVRSQRFDTIRFSKKNVQIIGMKSIFSRNTRQRLDIGIKLELCSMTTVFNKFRLKCFESQIILLQNYSRNHKKIYHVPEKLQGISFIQVKALERY